MHHLRYDRGGWGVGREVVARSFCSQDRSQPPSLQRHTVLRPPPWPRVRPPAAQPTFAPSGARHAHALAWRRASPTST
eukprot:11225977-Alexandrium_andersonii.AAC.1